MTDALLSDLPPPFAFRGFCIWRSTQAAAAACGDHGRGNGAAYRAAETVGCATMAGAMMPTVEVVNRHHNRTALAFLNAGGDHEPPPCL